MSAPGAERPGASATLTRRTFLAASGTVGGGLLLAATIPVLARAGGPSAPAAPSAAQITVYARIAPSGAVTIFAPNPEIGQGVRVALPMLFAEELCIAWRDVTIEQADYLGGAMGDQLSGGSWSVPFGWLPLRRAGAAGRTLLVAAAATTWGVPAEECGAADGVITHRPSGRTLGFGAVAPLAATLPVPDLATVVLKDEASFTIIGRSIVEPDKARVVVGDALFGIDVVVPGMRYAVIQKGPVIDATVKRANLDAIRRLPGVRHAFVLAGGKRLLEDAVPPNSPGFDDAPRAGVAIVADSWWQAQRAREQLEVEWDDGPFAHTSTAGFDAQAQAAFARPPAKVLRSDGDATAALARAARVLRAEYSYPFLAHATLEPMNCTASWRDGTIELWAPSQTPGWGRAQVAAALGIAPERVTVHVCRCGGGFGRRLMNDYMVEAALISREVGAPVKLLWSREDDLQHDFFRPAGYHSLEAGLDDAGRVIAWRDHFVGVSRTAAFASVTAPNPGAESFPAGFVAHYLQGGTPIPGNVPVGPLRAPCDNADAFVFQSFLDELAHAAGRDPIEMQLEMLDRPLTPPPATPARTDFQPARMQAVIRAVRALSGWSTRTRLPAGTGLGFAWYWSHMGYVAQVHRVSVDRGGAVRSEHVWVVVDVGRHIVNPSNAENQVQGSVLDGLSVARGQRVTIERGHVVQRNFDQYPLLRNEDVPAITVQFLRTEHDTTGLGEPAYPSVIPAFVNAIFAASGRRVRTLPLA